MDATVEIEINPRMLVPDGPGRVAWLEKHGIPADSAVVRVTAPIATWARFASVAADGSVQNGYVAGTLNRLLFDFVRELVVARTRESMREHGRIPGALGPSDVSGTITGEEAFAEIGALIARERAARVAEEARRSAEVAEAAASRAAYEAERDKARAAAAEELARFQVAVGHVARGDDSLARAAAEGYPVVQRVLDLLAERLVHAVQLVCEAGGTGAPYSATACAEWPAKLATVRAAPSMASFRLLDAVTAAVRTQNGNLPPNLGTWAVSRIMRVDACPHPREEHFVTAVLATLETLEGLRQVTFSLEPIDCNHGPGMASP